jgi:hypothetical protein
MRGTGRQGSNGHRLAGVRGARLKGKKGQPSVRGGACGGVQLRAAAQRRLGQDAEKAVAGKAKG